MSERQGRFVVKFRPGPHPEDPLHKRLSTSVAGAFGLKDKIIASRLPHHEAMMMRKEAHEKLTEEGRVGKVIIVKDIPPELLI